MTEVQPRYAISYQRISSTQQRDGTGLERQSKAAEQWCEDNGYTLLSGEWVDSGLSGYTGQNIAEGALGRIVDGVSQGHIPKGTFLLVEQWDRFTRENHMEARQPIEALFRAGISIVTLNDGQVWNEQDYRKDLWLAVKLLFSIDQAHRFSENLSRRLTAAWQTNTEKVKAGTRKRSKAAPRWLEFRGTLDDGYFEVKPEVAATVIEVYTRYANGETTYSIANDLRNRGVPLISGKHTGWRQSNIRKIVSSKAPYGILELGKGRKNDRVLTGEVINDYFPRIVDEETQRKVLWRLNKPTAGLQSKGAPKVNTKAILTGLAWFNAGDEHGWQRATRAVDSKGKGTLVTMVTRKYIGAQSYVEKRFLEGWAEIVSASDAEITHELTDIEAALTTAYTTLDLIQKSQSPRLIAAAQADVEELEEALREQRKATLLSSLDIPEEASEIAAMEPHEANGLLRKVIKRIEITKGSTDKPKLGAPLWFDVTLRNGARVSYGDARAVFNTQ